VETIAAILGSLDLAWKKSVTVKRLAEGTPYDNVLAVDKAFEDRDFLIHSFIPHCEQNENCEVFTFFSGSENNAKFARLAFLPKFSEDGEEVRIFRLIIPI
jgi:hypothetical protein